MIDEIGDQFVNGAERTSPGPRDPALGPQHGIAQRPAGPGLAPRQRDAPISISESRPNPASATDRAEAAAMASTTIPATFQASVTYSRAKPRRSRALRAGLAAGTTGTVWHPACGGY